MEVTRKQNTPNFPKNEHFLPPNTHCTCAHLGARNIRLSENLVYFVFLLPLFWDSPFCLITYEILEAGICYDNKFRTVCLFLMNCCFRCMLSWWNNVVTWSVKDSGRTVFMISCNGVSVAASERCFDKIWVSGGNYIQKGWSFSQSVILLINL